MNICCAICTSSFSNYRKLSKHVRDQHRVCSQVYYDSHVKGSQEGICEFCQSPTKFMNISKGYSLSCKKCKAEKAKQFRSINRANPEKHAKFVEKVKENQTKIWKKRKESGEDTLIRSKIGTTIKRNNQNLTQEQLNERYGWLNKLSEEEKELWKKEVMFNTGMHKWWKEATHEDIRTLVVKRIATITETAEDLVAQVHGDPASYLKYHEAVWYITAMNYAKFRHKLDPHEQRGSKWHLDHIYSVKAGFLNSVDPYIIGSVANLRIVSKEYNLKKNAKCDITLEELKLKYNEQI